MNPHREVFDGRRRAFRAWIATLAILVLAACAEPVSGPALDIDFPASGEAVAQPTVDVVGSVSSPVGVAEVTAASGGSVVPCEVFADGGFVCSGVPLAGGDNAITVTATDAQGASSTRTVTVARVSDGFEIALHFFNDAEFTPSQRQAFYEAADVWSSVITNDLEDVAPRTYQPGEACGSFEGRALDPGYSGPVDDVLIFVTGFERDRGGVLGLATPCRIRSSGPDAGTNAIGYMEFDVLDLEDLENDGQLVETILHEMGHVLGIGTNWHEDGYHDLLDYRTSDPGIPCELAFPEEFVQPPRYTGQNGIAAYGALGGSGPVPVEEEGGLGTQCGHWDEEVFGNELMTGFLDMGRRNPMSLLTVRSLQDIGFDVDVDRAEPYSLPTLRAQADADALPIGEREIVLPPRGGIDPSSGDLEGPEPR